MPDEQKTQVLATTVARYVERDYSLREREAVGAWLQRLLEIRGSGYSVSRRVKQAVEATDRSVILPIARHIGEQGKRIVWTERSWAARLAFGAAGAAAITTAGQGAGIAALGGAIGVPLWVVFGAGGSFAGMLLDELGFARPAVAKDVADQQVIDADWEFADEAELAETLNKALEEPEGKQSLLHFAMKSYRSARNRQQKKSEAIQLNSSLDDELL